MSGCSGPTSDLASPRAQTPAVSQSSDCTITTFSLGSPAVAGTIVGTSISVILPAGTDLTKLVAQFTTTGASVAVNKVVQKSGVTSNDFSFGVSYVVTAADGTKKTYIVTASQASAVDMISFSIPIAGTYATKWFEGAISGTNITVTLPYGTAIGSFKASFTSTTFSSVYVGATLQTSGTSTNDFSKPMTYTVKNGKSTKNYVVTVVVALNPAKAITSFQLALPGGPALGVATTSPSGFAVTIPFAARHSLSSLVATFVTTGASVAVGGTTQVSGTTANDFTKAVVYTVTAADGTNATYSMTVSVAAPVVSAYVPAKSFVNPRYVAADATGNLYVSDLGTSSGQGTLSKIDGSGTVTILASGLASPRGVAWDALTGNLYFVDYNEGLVKKFASGTVSTVAGSGHSGADDGSSVTATFSSPDTVTVDRGGNLFVSAGGKVRKVTFGTSTTVSTVTVTPYSMGTNYSVGVAVDSAGVVYSADNSGSVIRKLTFPGPTATDLTYLYPQGVTVDSADRLYDIESDKIKEWTSSGSWLGSYSVTGSPSLLSGVVDQAGNLYVVSYTQKTILLLK